MKVSELIRKLVELDMLEGEDREIVLDGPEMDPRQASHVEIREMADPDLAGFDASSVRRWLVIS